MNPAHGSRHLLVGMALAAVLVAARPAISQPLDPAAPVAAPTQNQLRWKPHRAGTQPGGLPGGNAADLRATTAASPSSRPAMNEAAADTASRAAAQPPAFIAHPATSPVSSANAAASVVLPDGVPPIAVPNDRSAGAFAPLRGRGGPGMGDWMSPHRLAGDFRAAFTDDPTSGLGAGMMRSPQGERGRPLLAPEVIKRPPAPVPTRVSDAPRFNPNVAPNGVRWAGPRTQRIAMNVDGIPSVMTRGPQAAAVDESAGNQLPAPSAGESLPPGVAVPGSSAEFDDSSMMMNSSPEMQGEMTEGYDPQLTFPDSDGLLMGQYPSQLHVESFYDDPYACEDECGLLPLCQHEGRICAWLRRFGRPYYGWKWYRDLTVGAGSTSFQNATDLGLHGNYGVNEYANWAMPFWNAFGVGWQVGVRGVQANFNSVSVQDTVGNTILNTQSRNQVFVTTGFFTRAFEGRGFQGGAVYDYLRDNWYDGVDVSQVRGEISYVWGYHEAGFWAASNVKNTNGIYSTGSTANNVASTLDLYAAFYRLQFGDANEWKVWAGATGFGNGLVGSTIRAPMGRSFALEGAFTYVMPDTSKTVPLPSGDTLTYNQQAWNMSVNLVFYPAGRSRRSLASPYRPLFDVADNGTMIRSISLPHP